MQTHALHALLDLETNTALPNVHQPAIKEEKEQETSMH